MRAAAIDVGSNSTLSLLAEHDGRDFHTLRDDLTINQLGASLDAAGNLSQDVMALNIDYLSEVVRDYRREGAEAFALCGTAALRRARNARDFAGAIRKILGLELEIISGRDEAALTFAGAISGKEIYPGERTGVVDLGGGSTEVIAGLGTNPAESISLDLGAVSLTREFLVDDPPTHGQTEQLSAALRTRLPLLMGSFAGKLMPWTLVGGTAVSLAILQRGLRRYAPDLISGSTLTADDLTSWVTKFEVMHSQEIQSLPGMPLGRAPYMLAGTILWRELYSQLGIVEATVSERGLRHGLWLAKFSVRRVK
jgi:exopolyphosphatase/guanosine-5'-triphosphate,3'-diphosphate pyrophosphatase